MICYECGAEMRETSEPIMESVRGVMTCVDGVPHWQCDECGNNVTSVEDATFLSKMQLAQVAHAKGLLSPEEIRGIRARFGLTQAQFEKMLGVSTPTASRWETGAMLPSKTASILMRTFRRHPEVVNMANGMRRYAFSRGNGTRRCKAPIRWKEAYV